MMYDVFGDSSTCLTPIMQGTMLITDVMETQLLLQRQFMWATPKDLTNCS